MSVKESMYNREMKIMMGYIREVHKRYKLSYQVPIEIIKLCHTFYHSVKYRWDMTTKSSDRLRINKECDTVVMVKISYGYHNIFSNQTLELNKIHKINFKIYAVSYMLLGICEISSAKKYVHQTAESFGYDCNAYGYYSEGELYWNGDYGGTVHRYHSGDQITMIVDLKKGQLTFQVNEEEICAQRPISKDTHYKVAVDMRATPNKVKIIDSA